MHKRAVLMISVASIAAAGLATAAALGATTPTQGSIAGPVTTVKSGTFTVKTSLSPTGSALVKTNAKTTISRQITAKRTDLKSGVCVTANGLKNSKGVVAATRVTVSYPTKGSCGGRVGGTPPRGNGSPTPQPPSGAQRPANAGFAAGMVSSIKGSTLTVTGRDGKTSTVTVSSKTSIRKTASVKPSQVGVKECAFVRGTSTDKGITVLATNVSLSQPVNGSCSTPQRTAGPRASN